MKKINLLLFLFIFLGMQHLAAQDSTEAEPSAEGSDPVVVEEPKSTVKALENEITFGVKAAVRTSGKISMSKDDKGQYKKNSISHSVPSAKASITANLDITDIAGLSIALEAGSAPVGGKEHFTLGDSYAYAHVLKAFGIDSKIADLKLKVGSFSVKFSNAKHAGQNGYLGYAKQSSISKSYKELTPGIQYERNPQGAPTSQKTVYKEESKIRPTVQADFKILDMFTLRAGLGLSKYHIAASSRDVGVGLLFDKSFGEDDAHAIRAALSYTTVLTYATYKDLAEEVGYFNALAFNLGYTGKIASGRAVLSGDLALQVLGLGGMTTASLIAGYGRGINYSFAAKFAMMDSTLDFELLGLGVDLGGLIRPIADPKNDNLALQGIAATLSTDALKALMGDNYLSVSLSSAFNVGISKNPNTPALDAIGLTLGQYLFNKGGRSVKLTAGFKLSNSSAYELAGGGTKDTLDSQLLGVKQTSNTNKLAVSLGLTAKLDTIIMSEKF